MKKIIEKIKKWIAQLKTNCKNLVIKVKNWFNKTALPWIKNSWMQIANVFIVMYAYSNLYDLDSIAAGLVGLWLFILLAYWIFWKFFGFDKVYNKYIEDKQKAKNKKTKTKVKVKK